MRNLKLQFCKQFSTKLNNAKFLLFDSNTDVKSYVVTDTKLYLLPSDEIGADAEEIIEVPGIVGAEYLALENEICLATEMGEVMIVNPQTHCINEGTYCDVGIECMSWSPDQEVVVFVTKAAHVVVMTCTYDPLAEHPLAEQCSGDGQFVNVGWGKKETQFHGSEGKTAAKQKQAFRPPENINALPKNIEISWRADGAYFAVSFVNDVVGRMFKVFDREGNLQFISEKVNDLQPALAWRPSGTWIAVPQRLPNKSIVALFEKNGLRHREIVLRFDLAVEPIVDLKWSSDSDILTIETENVAENKHSLYLYTIGNYHWYLKYQLSFDLSNPIAAYTWDNRIGEEKTMHVMLANGKYLIYRWHFGIDKLLNSGIVAVIDGNRLLLSDFSKAVVPPPMCTVELKLDGDLVTTSTINACVLTGHSKKRTLVLYDAKERFHIYECAEKDGLKFEKLSVIPFNNDEQFGSTPSALANMLLISNTNLMTSITINNISSIICIRFDNDRYSMFGKLEINGTINAMCHCRDGGSTHKSHEVFAQILESSQIYAIDDITENIWRRKSYVQLKRAADQLEWSYIENTAEGVGETRLISLRTNQCLYVNDQRIAEDVTSFSLAADRYLVFTKLNVLYFMRLSDLRVVSERKIERGGKIIATIVNDARIVLQLPRGNLEAITPRILALDIIGALLQGKEYYRAMDVLRKQRINLNIICDHNMNAFLQNLDVFLDEITNSNWLNLFLSDLQNEDFTKTMYASNYTRGFQTYPEGFKIEQKVTYLCEKICERMEQRAEIRFQLPIITAYVKIGCLEKALDIIWQQKRREAGSTEVRQAEDALKYLLYLVDVNELYNVALGTYDFGLVLFVAQKSQKDPKEFLPFLNELKALELNYRTFKIDEHLKRYERALQAIAKCGDERFDEALEFVKRHQLYKRALECYKDLPQCYQRVCLAFGDYLRANGKLENASLMYERGGNLTQAMLSAKHVLDWQRVLVLAGKDTTQQQRTVALSLISSLQEHGKYDEAFHLLKTYGNNFTQALQCLLKGRLFLKAIFEANMQPKENTIAEDLIATIIEPDLLQYHKLLDTNILGDQELFVSYKQRLLDVRERKRLRQQQLEALGDADDGEIGDNFEVDECDLLSDTTSMRSSSRYSGSSRGTGKTFRSSKNRRKHERKLLSLKPGNPFEDIALIDALYNHIMKIVQQQQHVRDTCKALIELQHDDEATTLQHHYKQLLTMVQDSLDDIWIPEMMTAQQFLTGPNIDYTQLQNEQRYGMINPQKRFKPQLNIIDWEHEILR